MLVKAIALKLCKQKQKNFMNKRCTYFDIAIHNFAIHQKHSHVYMQGIYDNVGYFVKQHSSIYLSI